MRRTELLPEIRKMQFEEVHEGWRERRRTQPSFRHAPMDSMIAVEESLSLCPVEECAESLKNSPLMPPFIRNKGDF